MTIHPIVVEAFHSKKQKQLEEKSGDDKSQQDSFSGHQECLYEMSRRLVQQISSVWIKCVDVAIPKDNSLAWL